MTTEAVPKPMLTLEVDEFDIRLLWQLLNAPNVVVPISEAAAAERFYAKVKAAALAHGIAEA